LKEDDSNVDEEQDEEERSQDTDQKQQLLQHRVSSLLPPPEALHKDVRYDDLPPVKLNWKQKFMVLIGLVDKDKLEAKLRMRQLAVNIFLIIKFYRNLNFRKPPTLVTMKNKAETTKKTSKNITTTAVIIQIVTNRSPRKAASFCRQQRRKSATLFLKKLHLPPTMTTLNNHKLISNVEYVLA
jgi:hypothetical protein